MRFPRTIRLDGSDLQTFAPVAEPGELAVSGAFAFAGLAEDAIVGPVRQAFANGFLGTGSWGWSTFVAVAEIDDAAYDGVVQALAGHFVETYGAPDIAAALPAARAEAEFAAGLCDHPVNTLIVVQREIGADGMVERFRTVDAAAARFGQPRVWDIVAEDGDDG
jgi:hypothetical protein